MDLVWKRLLPLVLIALLVFLGVLTAFVWRGVERSQQQLEALMQEREPVRENLLITAAEDTGALSALLVVSIDPKQGKTDIISIPADTLVDVAGSNQKIAAVPGIGGMEMLLERLPELLPLPITHYIAYTPDTLARAIDLAGGAEITLPYGITDRASGVYLTRGSRVLTGNEAAAAVAYSGQGAAAQMTLQRQITQALLARLADRGADALQPMLGEMIAYVATDLSPYETAEYARLLTAVQGENIHGHDLPGSRQAVGGQWMFRQDVGKVNALVSGILE